MPRRQGSERHACLCCISVPSLSYGILSLTHTHTHTCFLLRACFQNKLSKEYFGDLVEPLVDAGLPAGGLCGPTGLLGLLLRLQPEMSDSLQKTIAAGRSWKRVVRVAPAKQAPQRMACPPPRSGKVGLEPVLNDIEELQEGSEHANETASHTGSCPSSNTPAELVDELFEDMIGAWMHPYTCNGPADALFIVVRVNTPFAAPRPACRCSLTVVILLPALGRHANDTQNDEHEQESFAA